jgi:CYTH domain-containing protein
MPLEFERKFLVAHDGWKRSVINTTRLRDGLIASNKVSQTTKVPLH